MTHEEYTKLRDNTLDKYGEKACYCGHSDMCDCDNPDSLTMKANTIKSLMQNIKL